MNIHPFATSSYFVRRDVFVAYAKSEISSLKAHGDHKMSIFFCTQGKTFYIAEPMSSYRVRAKGSINRWIAEMSEICREKAQWQLYENRVELLEASRSLFGVDYQAILDEGIRRLGYECAYKYALNSCEDQQ